MNLPVVSILLLCGLPCSGKSSLASSLSSDFPAIFQRATGFSCALHFLSFDEIFDKAATAWAAENPQPMGEFNMIIPPLEALRLAHSTRISLIESASALVENLQASSTAGIFHLVVVERTNHLQAMRRPFLRLAQRRRCGFGCLFLDVSLSRCVELNDFRRLRGSWAARLVSAATVEKIAKTLEKPGKQENSLTIEKAEGKEFEALVSFLVFLSSPEAVPPVANFPDENARAASRAESAKDFLHQLDCEMRRIIQNEISSRKQSGEINGRQLNERAQKINSARLEILRQVKNLRHEQMEISANFNNLAIDDGGVRNSASHSLVDRLAKFSLKDDQFSLSGPLFQEIVDHFLEQISSMAE